MSHKAKPLLLNEQRQLMLILFLILSTSAETFEFICLSLGNKAQGMKYM